MRNKQISTGNIRMFLTGCKCGRAFESDRPLERVPDHIHNHRLISGNSVHTCIGCSWEVETFTPPHDPVTTTAVNAAFAKHLLTTSLDEPE